MRELLIGLLMVLFTALCLIFGAITTQSQRRAPGEIFDATNGYTITTFGSATVSASAMQSFEIRGAGGPIPSNPGEALFEMPYVIKSAVLPPGRYVIATNADHVNLRIDGNVRIEIAPSLSTIALRWVIIAVLFAVMWAAAANIVAVAVK